MYDTHRCNRMLVLQSVPQPLCAAGVNIALICEFLYLCFARMCSLCAKRKDPTGSFVFFLLRGLRLLRSPSQS